MLKGYHFFKDESGEVIKIETPDLTIRTSVAEDVPTFYEWELSEDVTAFFSICKDQSLEQVWKTFIHDDENPAQRQFTILKKDSGKMLGRIVLADLIPGWKVEIFRIYLADIATRGKGYGKQAMLALMQLAFEIYDCKRLYLDHYTGNPARGLYDHLGFTFEGCLRDNCRKNGVLYDVQLMSMLRDEYDKLYPGEG